MRRLFDWSFSIVQPQPPDVQATPSEPVVSGDAAAAEPRSSEPQAAPSPSLWERIFGPHPKASGEAEAQQTDESSDAAASPGRLTLTEEELERRIQSETDRREAKRRTQTLAQQRLEREAAIERKLDPNSGEFDPYGGAEERAKLKAEEHSGQQFTELLTTVAKTHDSATLDVIVEALPPADRDRIFKIEGAGVGLDGRKLIVSEGLKALQKHWEAEGQRKAEARLREDPVFRKRVFTEHRGDVEEPELLPANGATSRGDWFTENVIGDYKRAKGRR